MFMPSDLRLERLRGDQPKRAKEADTGRNARPREPGATPQKLALTSGSRTTETIGSDFLGRIQAPAKYH